MSLNGLLHACCGQDESAMYADQSMPLLEIDVKYLSFKLTEFNSLVLKS